METSCLEINGLSGPCEGDFGSLALMKEYVSKILLLVSGVTTPRELNAVQVRLQLYPFEKCLKQCGHTYEFCDGEPLICFAKMAQFNQVNCILSVVN